MLESHSIGQEPGSMTAAQFFLWFLSREETVKETKSSAYQGTGDFEVTKVQKMVKVMQDDDATFVRLAFAVFQGTTPTDSELTRYTHMLDIESFSRASLAEELSGPKFYDEINAARRAPAEVIDPVWRPRPVDENGNEILTEEEKAHMAKQVAMRLAAKERIQKEDDLIHDVKAEAEKTKATQCCCGSPSQCLCLGIRGCHSLHHNK